MKTEMQKIYDIIESALALEGYETIAASGSGLQVFGNDHEAGCNYIVSIAPEAK